MDIILLARIIDAEASVLDMQAKIAVGQCYIDNNCNEKAFTTPVDKPSADALEAARRVANGERRFPNAKLLQFRSFTKYSDGNGNPDWSKIRSGICPITDLEYLGKDGKEPYGHFYFGVTNNTNKEPEYEMKLRLNYEGSDGINIRSTPEFTNNIVGVIHGTKTVYTVVDKSQDDKFYKLKSGVWITSDPHFVKVFEGEEVNRSYRVNRYDCYIRKGSGTNYANYDDPIMPGVYTIVEVKQGLGSNNGWGLLLSYSTRRNGWINLDEAVRVQ